SLSTQTDATGRYSFTGLRPGTYTITELLPEGSYLEGASNLGSLGGTALPDVMTLVLPSGGVGVNYDFGEVPLPPPPRPAETAAAPPPPPGAPAAPPAGPPAAAQPAGRPDHDGGAGPRRRRAAEQARLPRQQLDAVGLVSVAFAQGREDAT